MSRPLTEASLQDSPQSLRKTYMSTYELSRFLQKCQKERDEAFRREESVREKLKRLEDSTRSQIQDLKLRLKEANSESKVLQRNVKKLRTELGLEANPRFKGKMTKDIIKELYNQEQQVSQLQQDNQVLTIQLREIIPSIAQNQKQRTEMDTQLEMTKRQVQELLNENNRISQLLQESEREREELEKAHITLKKYIEEARQVTHRSVQTTTSIPVTLHSSYKRPYRDTPSSHVTLERRKNGSQNPSPITEGGTQKQYYSRS